MIAKLEEVEKTTTKHSLASALVAIGVIGHKDAVLEVLERNKTVAIKPLLEKALRQAGVDLSDYRRQEDARLQEWLRPRFGVAMLICGVVMLGAMVAYWNRAPRLLLSAMALYGATELALGALLLRKSSLALPAYVAFAGVGIVTLVTFQQVTSYFSWQLLVLIATVAALTLVYFGTLLFRDSE